MAQSNWEADKMLDVYIHDYLLKRNLHGSAKTFMTEGKVATEPVAIDAPGGFLFEWWSVFWDIFIARTNEKHSDVAAAYIEAQQMKAKEQQNQQAQMQQLQILQQRRAQMHRDTNHTSLNVPSNGMNPDNILGQSPASVMALKMYEEQLKQHPHTRDLDSSGQLLDANRLALLKSTGHHSRQLVQVTPGNAPMALQQVNARSQLPSDNKSDVNLSRSISIDPALYGLPGAMQSRPAIGDAGLNQGVSSLPLKGWPLTGIDRFRPSSGQQFSKVVLQSPNQLQQFQMFTPQQQQQLLAHAEAQAQAQGNLVSSLSANCADMDPRRLRVLRSGLNGKDVQPTGTDGSQHADSPIQTASSLVRAASKDQIELLMKMMAQMQQPVKYQQQHDQLQQQQSVQNGRKRKQMSHSGTANSSGTGNTPGPSPNSAPSTPSTHTPGDGMSMAGALPHNNSMSKNLMIYGSDGGTGGLASTSEHLDDLENFGDVGSLDDNVESFLSQDDGDTRDAAHVPKGFSFAELGRLRSSSGKVVCCHFSSDGKVLASAGHDKKVYLWNMDTLDFKSTVEEHSLLITDVRFRSNSAYFATSSFDKTLQVWNAADPSYSLFKLSGHTTQVTSLDFHPKKLDVLCSCDANNEIRLWNINQHASTRISKGGTRQVRFQHRVGQFLAAAAENVINIIDVETDQHQLSLQGHSKEVRSVCWDSSGDHLASVSEDCVRVWSVASGGECIHELSSNGNNFSSCTFHPSYSHLLIIGGYQSLELWHLTENKSMTIAAHEGLVAALENSPTAGMVASASHDKCVKVWK